MTELSVLLPCRINDEHQGPSRLRLTIETLLRQDIDSDRYEIILVDDGSDEPISDMFAAWGVAASNLRVIRQDPAGMCSAYNAAAAAARSELLFLAIDDNLADTDLLRRHIEAHRETRKPTVAVGRELYCWQAAAVRDVITGEVHSAFVSRPGESTLVDLLQLDEFRLSVADVRDRFDAIKMMSKKPAVYRDIEAVIKSGRFQSDSAGWLAMRYGNHSLPKSLFHDVGGVNTLFEPTGWYADLEFGYRLRVAGVSPLFLARAVTVHLPHSKPYMITEEGVRCLTEFYRSTNDVSVLMVPFFFTEKLTVAEFSRIADGLQKKVEQ
ncbi:glycosyltransferase [Nocardia niwae]|uniref:Glycosyltransferase family A protein n=1 Tax=Nocardia niwae TaxID=626084 RepID=A0ABV2X937_9NOCA